MNRLMGKNFPPRSQKGINCRCEAEICFGMHSVWLSLLAVVWLAFVPTSLFAEQSVQLQWEPNPDPAVIGYNIYYGTSSGNYSAEVSVDNVSSAILIGLVEGTTYYIVATSRDSTDQQSPPSEEISYTVPDTGTPPPEAPPALVLSSNQTGTAISLDWEPNPDPMVVGYNIYYGTSSGNYTTEISVDNSTSATLTNLVGGATYYIAATSHNAAGQESPASEEISFAVPNPPSAVPAAPVLALVRVPTGDGTSQLYITATGNVPANWTIESSTNLQTWSWYQDGAGPSVNVPINTTDAQQMFFRLTDSPGADPIVLSLTIVQLADGTSAVNITATGPVPGYWLLESSTDLQNWNWYVDGTDPAVNVQIPVFPDTPQVFFRLWTP